jgi:hypothetical protein
MASTILPTIDYANRQVDVELLQTITYPAGVTQMSLSNIQTTPKIVTGVQKALQRFISLLLTPRGSSTYDTLAGTELLPTLTEGRVQSVGQFQHIFGIAAADVLQQMRADDDLTNIYGTISDEEIIRTVTVLTAEVDYATSTLRAEVLFTMAAGDQLTYVIPVPVPR